MTANRKPGEKMSAEKLATDLLEAVNKALRIIDAHRAEELRKLLLWKSGGCLARSNQRPAIKEITAQEQAAIQKLWNVLPGSACLMDAIALLCHAPAYHGPAKESPLHTFPNIREDSAGYYYSHWPYSRGRFHHKAPRPQSAVLRGCS